jgi:Transposase, Mutator family
VERIRAQIDERFASEQDLGRILEDMARLSVRLVIQAALEAEVTEFLGWERYQRGERVRPGLRNGHQPVEVKTTAGPVVLERPKLRGTPEPFASGCWARASAAPTRWRHWSSPGSFAAWASAMSRRRWVRRSAQRRRCPSRPSTESAR